MLIYLLLPLVTLYCLFLSRATIVKNNNMYNGEMFISRNRLTLFLWAAILLGLAAFKGVGVGTDYPMYYNFFLNKSYNDVEYGISFIYDVSIKYNNFLVFSFLIYFLFLFFIFQGIKKNCPNYLISILMFIFTYTYFTSYNQLRQMIAVSIIFCFVNYLISNRKLIKIKYLVVILIALLFHNSAIFMFSLFFIPQKKFSVRIVVPLFLMTIILYFIPEFKNQIGNIIVKLSGSYMEKYSTNLDFFFEVNKEKGLLQLIPVVIQMVIVSLSLCFPKNESGLNINAQIYNFSTNLVVINLCLYSLAGIEAIDRLQIYFSCFNIYFYSILIHLLLNTKKQLYGQVFIVFIVTFWILYYVLRLITNISGVVPYSFFN
ncbi:EpsG family protein [Priestia aryabhattai]|uniref:EpsG family protein n=1 Tax=Priestia aryabhattai TaxID=412384 RepID=UPI001CCC1C9F|nr:EpsG family protein [Priestia aryabhattai]MBZ6489057.1 EpsG family protein [Priestia aryabhattai]